MSDARRLLPALFPETFSPGRVASAFWIKPGTLRSWHADPLGLACEPAGTNGQRRYAWADAALVGLVADLTSLYNGNPGMAASRAIALANGIRDFVWITAAKAESFKALDDASPVAIAWGDRGRLSGWRTQGFATLAEWSAAIAGIDLAHRNFPLDCQTIDVAWLLKRTASALTRPGIEAAEGSD